MTSSKRIEPDIGNGAHIVVVGGSGMLAGLCLSLTERGYRISVVCRSRTKFERNVSEKTSHAIEPVYVDYRNDHKLAEEIAAAETVSGPIVGTVAWIHPEQSKSAPGVVAKRTQKSFFAVLGSTDGRWDAAEPVVASIRSSNPALSVHTVALGHVRVPILGTARWLTNKEISDGVLAAFDEAKPHYVVGTLD